MKFIIVESNRFLLFPVAPRNKMVSKDGLAGDALPSPAPPTLYGF